MAKSSNKGIADPLDFEAALAELEAVVEALESGELNLADSLSRFERGVALSRQCQGLLEQARQTVSVLLDPEDPSSERPLNAEGDPAQTRT